MKRSRRDSCIRKIRSRKIFHRLLIDGVTAALSVYVFGYIRDVFGHMFAYLGRCGVIVGHFWGIGDTKMRLKSAVGP